MLDFIQHIDLTAAAGVLAAGVLFFDRLAKVIPSQSTNKIVQILQKVCAVLGVKVPDIQ